jgi:hypothetical protein
LIPLAVVWSVATTSVDPVLKTSRPNPYYLAPVNHRIPTVPTNGPSVHPTPSSLEFIRYYQNWTVGLSDGTLSFSFPFMVLTLENKLSLILARGIFASMESGNVYKNMLNNMISHIDHVVMNHKTNNTWGHVRCIRTR